jgi:HEAT repeat protein/peptidoglycan/xylan/chitin deacetylase (PgdA/CDA1 family)
MACCVRIAVAVALISFAACPAMAREPSPAEVQLRQSDVNARIEAAKKLAIEKDPATAETLTAALKDNEPLVKRFAIYGLQRIGNPAAATAIAPLVKDKDAWVRRTAAKALGGLASKPSVPVLVEALKDKDLLVRVDAFVALGAIGDPGSQKAIVAAAGDPRLWSEMRIGDQVLVLQALEQPRFTDPSVKELLLKLLDYGQRPHPEFEKLTEAQRQDSILQIVNQAAFLLAEKFHDASGEAWLVKGVENINDDGMMQGSMKALGTLKSKRGTAAIVKLLERAWTPSLESFMNNDRYCIEALGQIGDLEAVAPLEKFLAHPDYRLRRCAAAALEQIDGRKREVAPDGPAAAIPQIADKDLATPGGKRPPQFIVLAVDDCANLEGVEAILDICQSLKARGAKVVFTLYLAPLLSGDSQTDDLEKKKLIYQTLFDMGCEIAHHTLHHNPSWRSLSRELQIQEIEGCSQWDRDNIVGFTRPFSFKSPGGVRSAPTDAEFTRGLLARQNFIYSGGRGAHPNDQMWPQPGQWPMRVPTGSLDSNAPPVHVTITDGIRSDYPGRFDFEVAEGLAMWKANFDYHYNHPRRPILSVNAFHDWALRHLNNANDRSANRNEARILKAFLLDVLVTNKDKYPDTYSVTFRQVVEYVNTNGDLKQTLAIGNGQDSRNPVKPSIQ